MIGWDLTIAEGSLQRKRVIVHSSWIFGYTAHQPQKIRVIDSINTIWKWPHQLLKSFSTILTILRIKGNGTSTMRTIPSLVCMDNSNFPFFRFKDKSEKQYYKEKDNQSTTAINHDIFSPIQVYRKGSIYLWFINVSMITMAMLFSVLMINRSYYKINWLKWSIIRRK